MARKVEEELVGYNFAVRQVEVAKTDPKDGQVIHNGDGTPKTVPNWVLDLVCQTPFELHIVHVSFNEEGKRALVEALTGVAVASRLPQGAIEL